MTLNYKLSLKNTFLISSLTCFSFLLSACSESPDLGNSISESAEEIRSEVAQESGIDLIPLDFFEWDLQMSNIGGQITVMDFWATWCIPCIERFPAMVELSNHYPRDKVRFVSVNIDDFTDEDAYISALDFLTVVGADFENYQLQQDMFDIFNFFGLQSIPAVTIYDTSGTEQVRLTGIEPRDLFTEEDIVAAIEDLLAQPLTSEI
jgi:thiol-disulfide isomerase/thioredoxin